MTIKLIRRSFWVFPLLPALFVVLCAVSTPAIAGNPWDWESPQATNGSGWNSLGKPHDWESPRTTTTVNWRTRDGDPWDWERPMSSDAYPHDWEGPETWNDPTNWEAAWRNRRSLLMAFLRIVATLH